MNIKLEDEDIDYLRELAERDYVARIAQNTLAPNIQVTFTGDISQEMDYEKIGPAVAQILQDEIDTTDILLKSGANIYEINAIRRHISEMNGGMLAKRIAARGAELIGFGISDAVGTPPTGDIGVPYAKYRGTPMGPDQTTLEEARRVIRDYDNLNQKA